MSEIPEAKALFAAAQDYLEGGVSISELNGLATDCLRAAFDHDAPELLTIAEEWMETINRRWDEWSLERKPLSEDEFREWLKLRVTQRSK